MIESQQIDKEKIYREDIYKEKMYKTAKLIELSISLARALASDSSIEQIYRYGKIVDYSDKGFECHNAMAIMNLLKLEGFDFSKLDMILANADNILHGNLDHISNKTKD